MNYCIKLGYLKSGAKAQEIIMDGNKYTNADLELELIASGERITLKLTALAELSALNVLMQIDTPPLSKAQFYSNGYQSWTYSREYNKHDRYIGIATAVKPFVKFFGGTRVGDYKFVKYPKRKGVFNSCSHCYLRNGGATDITIFGSHNDRLGYTYFTADLNHNNIAITRDLEGLCLDKGEHTLLDVHIVSGEYDAAWDEYFRLIDIVPRTDKKLCGYTSWYNYYRNISEGILSRDLENLANLNIDEVNIFQIDDGYQPFVGDLTCVDAKKFPQGMRHMCDLIHDRGMLAGLWACPFGVTLRSQTYRQHFNWLLKNRNGSPVLVGAAWGGFYALDFYNLEAREYIRSSLRTMIDDWGFDMLKLDFLYAACAVPRAGKTRAMIMYEVMEWLRETVGEEVLLLACGAPLMPCFGVVDYCRIGADVTFSWSIALDKYISRELLSTRKTILNTISRRYLDKRAFLNDPDVFILREFNTTLMQQQKHILYNSNRICGSVLFMSDDVGGYDQQSIELLRLIYRDANIKIITADIIEKNTIFIRYTLNNSERIFVFDFMTAEILRDQQV